MKSCSKCKISKSFTEFHKNSCMRDGFDSYCTICRKELDQAKYIKHKEKILLQSKKYYAINKDAVSQRHIIYNKEYHKKKRATDPLYRLHINFSRSMRRAIVKNNKSWSTFVGYKLEQLQLHFEAQFQDGMSWDNYGKGGWVIDHIKPICSFTKEQFEECWALKNLRPLWEKDNIKKSAQDKLQSIK